MIKVTTEAFRPEAPIPKRFTADGENVSPPLRWAGLPPGTRELALIADDPDAPTAQPFIHWVVYKIPPTAGGLPEGVGHQAELSSPAGGVQGKNSFKQVGYGGPAPPPGHGTHHYHFRVYALDEPVELTGGVDAKSLVAAMTGHILEEADLVGTYRR